MKLENIGFYTLSDNRVRKVSKTSPMQRCEVLLSDKCNFNCPYCRGVKEEYKGDRSLEEMYYLLNIWNKYGLKNIRFSGGEPTLYPQLETLLSHIKDRDDFNLDHIAISTNGYSDIELYKRLVKLGVNDFSISLDSCCSEDAKMMSGIHKDVLPTIKNNIKELSKLTYVTVGIVLTESNVDRIPDIVMFADSLGVSDIRVISAAQYNRVLEGLSLIPDIILNRHPILKYRVSNFMYGRNVRGLMSTDYNRCALVIDDSAVAGGYHFPCIIYLREGGSPIGKISSSMREERIQWFKTHNTHEDPICKNNCLDVCIDHNNKYGEFHDH